MFALFVVQFVTFLQFFAKVRRRAPPPPPGARPPATARRNDADEQPPGDDGGDGPVRLHFIFRVAGDGDNPNDDHPNPFDQPQQQLSPQQQVSIKVFKNEKFCEQLISFLIDFFYL